MGTKLIFWVKCLSIVAMTVAVGLELWHFRATAAQSQQFLIPPFLLWGAHLALTAHGLEGLIAAVYAARQKRSPLVYAVYTFFVGTVGLMELYQLAKQPPELAQPQQGIP